MMQRGFVNLYDRLMIDILMKKVYYGKNLERPPRVVYWRCYDYVSGRLDAEFSSVNEWYYTEEYGCGVGVCPR